MSERSFVRAIKRSRVAVVLLSLGLAASVLGQEARTRDDVRPDDGRSKPEQREASGRLRPPERGDWELGVAVRVLDVGVEIERVFPRSAAQRAGLEPRDVIIAVSGYQVGRVADRNYPLEDELQRRADARGQVRLLVQNRRNRELVNLDVQLTRGGGEAPDREVLVRGTATYRERIAAPRNGRLRVQVVDRGGFLGAERVIAEREYRNVANPPYTFELPVARSEIEPRRRYEVRIMLLEAGGRPFMEGRESVELSPGQSPRPVEVLLSRPR